MMLIRRLRIEAWLCALILGLLVSQAGAANVDAERDAAFTALLAQHVRWDASGSASSVDYAGFQRDRAALKSYLDALSAVPPAEFDRWPLNRKQAFLINAYNAYTIELVLTRYPDLASIKDLGGWFSSPWKQRFFQLLGESRSLDDVEHTLLRGDRAFDEPRIHFAVNCASIGCPALRPEAYAADRLDAQLEDQTRRFLRDRSRNYYRASDHTLVVSKIFDWYADDFNDETVMNFLQQYSDELTDDPAAERQLARGAFDVAHSDYDWRLNRQP